MFKIDEIREIIKLVDQSSIQRFEIEQETTKLVLVKNDVSPIKPTVAATTTCNDEIADYDTKSDIPVIAAEKEPDLYKIVSPVVGTFYAASEPDAEPFVKLGKKVTAETVVCVVEVMKLFNEVEAGVNGEIVEILVKDGEFVEYGQPLFIVRVDK